MADPKKIYWDSCIWISLIRRDQGRAEICDHFLESAKKKEVQIWTSSLTLAEVFKKKCGAINVAIDPESDSDFEQFIEQDFLFEVQVDHDIGVTARNLLRQHSELKKPADAIHLATAVRNNLDELHTFDGDNLLVLNGKILRLDGKPLHILKPKIPKDTQIPLPLTANPSLESVENDKQNGISQAAGDDKSHGGGGVAPDAEHTTAAAQTGKAKG